MATLFLSIHCPLSCLLRQNNSFCDIDCNTSLCTLDYQDCLNFPDQICDTYCTLSSNSIICSSQTSNCPQRFLIQNKTCSDSCKKKQGNKECDDDCNTDECNDDGGDCEQLNPIVLIVMLLIVITSIGLCFCICCYIIKRKQQELNQLRESYQRVPLPRQSENELVLILTTSERNADPIQLEKYIEDQFPAIPYTDELSKYQQTECVICFDGFIEEGSVRVLSCGHIFHSQCIDEWITSRSYDPRCAL